MTSEVLLDSSAWIEYLRATDSPTNLAVRALIDTRADMAVCEPVLMEVLAGGRSDEHAARLRSLLGMCRPVRTISADWEAAASLYRDCRRSGLTVRRLNDCLIAAIALRAGISILHADKDFDAIARVAPLRVRRA